MATFSEEDCEKLIELIRQYPPIYNAQLDSYRDENLKDNIWTNIAERINKKDLECRKKWKLIRDSYNRYKRKQKHSTGSAAPAKNSKWQFYERLRFLEKIPLERQSSTSVIEQISNTSSEGGHEDPPLEVTDESVHNTPSRESGPIPGTSTSAPEKSVSLSKSCEKTTKNRIKRNRQDDDLIKYLKERHEKRNSELRLLESQIQQPDDDISTFTKHIEMTLRKLTAHSRAMAKNEIFGIVSKYEIGDIERESERPYTSSSYNSYSPISVASSQHQTQIELIDLSLGQFKNISGEPVQNILNDEFEQNNFHDV
ncbi:madf domain transcription factor [Holotrichia oblita]|uniref:Madf domain transcription factor n=1 Tax=Holotrichia oblita TaxID=644536 RepID=A0ACB9SKQ5_HOLOL|nr:madf domain transcription factor [Holotrichia oblita]